MEVPGGGRFVSPVRRASDRNALPARPADPDGVRRPGPGFPGHLLDGLVGAALVLLAVAAWVEAAVTVPLARALAG